MYGYGYSYPNNPQGSGLMGRYEAGVRSDGGSFAFPIDTGLSSRLEGLGLLNASSLVNSCNAGKESVLYNLIPTPVQSLDRFAVTRSTVKWVLGQDGVLTSIPANTPAFEYNTDGTYRGLLVEPAGTNLIIRSNDFANASWDKTRSSISSNVLASPDGTTTADELIEDVQTGPHHTNIAFSVADSTTVTVSFFVKANTRLGCAVAIRQTDGATLRHAFFNLSTGAVTSADSGYTGSIQDYPDGWYRCSLTGSSGVGGLSARAYCFLLSTATSTSTSYTGDGTSSLYVWGAQAETGSVATSYIPTVASTQTRTADSVTLTGASSLIGQSAGTIYVEMEGRLAGANRTLISVSDGTNNNRINLQVGGGNTTETRIVSGGVTQGAIDAGAPSASVRKWALRYSSSGATLYRDGASVGTPLGAITIPATSIVRLGVAPDGSSNFLNGWLRSAVLFTSDIGNTSAIALTA